MAKKMKATNRTPRQIRFSDREYAEIAEAAEADETTASAVIRTGALKEARRITRRVAIHEIRGKR